MEKSESVRASFEARFSKDQASAIMEAAESHTNGVHDRMGSDPFKWALCICIGTRCFEEKARGHHGFTFTLEEVKEWALEHADLGNHDGDVDFIALLVGVYQEWLKMPAEKGVEYGC